MRIRARSGSLTLVRLSPDPIVNDDPLWPRTDPEMLDEFRAGIQAANGLDEAVSRESAVMGGAALVDRFWTRPVVGRIAVA